MVRRNIDMSARTEIDAERPSSDRYKPTQELLFLPTVVEVRVLVAANGTKTRSAYANGEQLPDLSEDFRADLNALFPLGWGIRFQEGWRLAMVGGRLRPYSA